MPTLTKQERRLYSVIEFARKQVSFAIYFRYVLAIIAISVLFFFRTNLPFAYPFFLIVVGAFLSVNIIVHIAFIRSRNPRLAFRAHLYIDSLIAPFIFYCSGGFLSPFILSHLLTLLVSGIIIEERNSQIRNSFLILFLGYVGVALLQKYGILSCPVPYAAELLTNNIFFYFVFSIIVLLMTGTYVFMQAVRDLMKAMLDELTNAFHGIVRGTTAVVGRNFFASLTQSLAEALKVPCVLVGRIQLRTGTFSTLAVWNDGEQPAGNALELPPSMFEGFKNGDERATETQLMRLFSGSIRQGMPPFNHVRGYLLHDAQRSPIGMLCIFYDGDGPKPHLLYSVISIFISRAAAELERMLADERQRVLESQLSQLQKMEALSHLTSGINHDLGNLVAIIGCGAELLSMKMRESPHVKWVHDILDAARHAGEIIQRMMGFSRKEQANVTIIDAHQIVNDVAELLRMAKKNTVDITLELLAPQSILRCDAALLQTALLNLGINARDAMEGFAGSLTISTAVALLDEGNILRESFKINAGGYLSIAVSDTGAGIPLEILPHIFEPFYTTKPKGKGTGLGLANVWGFIESSKGAIEVKSAVEKGTTFTMYLPLWNEAGK
jgi:signal transduction histidine kinase